MVWSCVDCTIIHEPDVAQEVLEELMVLKPGENLRVVFDRVIARRLV
jgi:Zn-finger protein